MKIVYVVTSGCYSDYSIDSIYDNREAADKRTSYLNNSDSWESAGVEEWELNVLPILPTGDTLYHGQAEFALNRYTDAPVIKQKVWPDHMAHLPQEVEIRISTSERFTNDNERAHIIVSDQGIKGTLGDARRRVLYAKNYKSEAGCRKALQDRLAKERAEFLGL